MAFKKGNIPWNKGLKGYHSGENHPFYGKHHTKQTKQKMSDSRKNLSNEARKKYSIANKGKNNPMYGKKHSDESKNKMSESQKGKELSKKHKQLISDGLKGKMVGKKNPFYGKKHSDETKEIISKNHRGEKSYWYGKKHTQETKKKMSIASKGKVKSNKHKKNIRLARIKVIENNFGFQISPSYNQKACEFFTNLNITNRLNGLHAENNGEYYIKELGYWLDYYEPNLNLVIEWDENSHFDVKGNLNEKDKLRQNEIENYLKCNFLRIRQDSNLNGQLNLILAYTEILKNRKYLS